jgi:C1A family cysteine protease
MNKKFSFICLMLLLFSVSSYAQITAKSPSFQLEAKKNSGKKDIKLSLSRSGSEKIDSDKPIDGLAITGRIIQKSPRSFVRVLLEDTNGKKYTVLESCRLYNDADTIVLSNYCEESKILADVLPRKLHVYLDDVSVDISGISMNYSENISKGKSSERISAIQEMSKASRVKQSQQIVNNINAYNKKNLRLWRASVTDVSLMPWESRKRVLGIDESCMPNGFEYYSSGIFEIGEPTTGIRSLSSSTSPYVDSFDWRNRHGKNWMTPVKHQGKGYGCWAFAAVGVTEALVNLYFNRKIDCDLSEQEVISCSGWGDNSTGGNEAGALGWISSWSISEEEAFQFSDSYEPCKDTSNSVEKIGMGGTARVYNYKINNNDSVKKALIHHGPITSGIIFSTDSISGHAMVLTGYSTLHEGDTIRFFEHFNQSPNDSLIIPRGDNRIGKTYWIFKNSYGTDSLHYEHQGYAYVLFNTDSCFIQPCYAKMPVRSRIYSNNDIAITDADGDGYYFWGLGNKPAHCPSWVPETSDGDDSDINYGPMDDYGHLATLPDGITIKTAVTDSIDSTTTKRIGIVENGTLTITGTTTLAGDAKIRVCENGTLIVDGGTLNNAKIDLVPGSHLIVRNNGTINMATGEEFAAPIGAIVDIEYGSIN